MEKRLGSVAPDSMEEWLGPVTTHALEVVGNPASRDLT